MGGSRCGCNGAYAPSGAWSCFSSIARHTTATRACASSCLAKTWMAADANSHRYDCSRAVQTGWNVFIPESTGVSTCSGSLLSLSSLHRALVSFVILLAESQFFTSSLWRGSRLWVCDGKAPAEANWERKQEDSLRETKKTLATSQVRGKGHAVWLIDGWGGHPNMWGARMN
eukprot:scaffold1936_cov362-Pinguiococcus_pyrenoidosus.AAC.5